MFGLNFDDISQFCLCQHFSPSFGIENKGGGGTGHLKIACKEEILIFNNLIIDETRHNFGAHYIYLSSSCASLLLIKNTRKKKQDVVSCLGRNILFPKRTDQFCAIFCLGSVS
jgi:hypothetical protein